MDGKSAGTTVIVVLPEEIDVTNSASVAASLAVSIDHAGLVIADMTGTAFCDSSGVQALLTAHQRAVARGCALRVVVRPGGGVARVLTIVGLDRILDVYASLEDATPAGPAAFELTDLPGRHFRTRSARPGRDNSAFRLTSLSRRATAACQARSPW